MDFNNSVGFSSTPSDLPLHHQAERTGAVGVDAKDMHRLGKRQEFKRNLFFLELPWIRIGVDGDLGVYFDVAVSELLLSWSCRTLLVLHHYCFVPQHHHSFSSRNDGINGTYPVDLSVWRWLTHQFARTFPAGAR